MDRIQLNSEALAAQNGDLDAMWRIKYHFQKFIIMLSDVNRNKISSQESFETQCFKLVEDKVLRYNPDKDNLEWIIRVSFYKRLKRSKDRFITKSKGAVFNTLPSLMDGDGNEEDILEDDLAIIDEEVLLNERITSLAAGDPVNLAILSSWIDKSYNDSETAKTLACIYGGKSESYRKSIQRFRSRCQKALACTG